HPFLRSPAIFIYRNPLDILVSEANYYPQEGKAAFYGYFQDRSFEERLLKLIDDPWLMGSFRDRIGSFLPWLDFKNVLPVSFEELVGPRGGGDRHRQVRTVWSLMLKLHVPGNAKSIADALFREDSPTFREATLGAHQRHFSERAYKKFFSLPQDFMEILGYGAGLDPDCPFPARAEEFRKRPLELGQYDCSSIPIAVNNDFLNYSIVKFRRRYYGVPNELGLDLNELDDADLAALLSGETEDQVKKDILLKDLIQQLDRRIHDHLRAHRPLKVLRPFVLWFFGPPETGKRNLIRKFQRSLETLSPDSVTVLSGDPWVRSQEERDPHPEAGASAVSELARKAEDLAQSGISVCIDLSFSGSQVRDRIRAVSPQFIAIDCVAPEAEEPLASSARTRQETASPETRETSETGTPSAESTLPESWVLALPWRDSGKSVRDLFRKLQEEQYIEFTHPQWEDELDSTLPQELETLMGAGSEVLVDPAALVEMQKKIQKLE
ncbi:MAG: hypothetical protein GWM98_17855, partial [Nitrospinaceae bacterium]|nr:hypothetical protein [Nitrospinaceae bacterium]NIR56014.1 hypothetical protein [Nitrospinaceae bacterium]NIT83293.1 hypothetical protein [Nitrospinaceae bacterium]NIU45503.1 hypothetical protein [Nitrospinaceae bacterium]NIU97656.1 hypothetical protein [Nitrospinaceae bacterium]